MSTETIPRESVVTDIELLPYEDDGSKDARAHIVNPPRNLHIWQVGMSAQDLVDIARSQGLEVVALCGYRWVPKRNPDKYDVCYSCIKIAGGLMRDNDE